MESVGSSQLRHFPEDAIHLCLHYLSFDRVGVIVPDEMQYSMDKQVKDHFTVSIAQHSGIIR